MIYHPPKYSLLTRFRQWQRRRFIAKGIRTGVLLDNRSYAASWILPRDCLVSQDSPPFGGSVWEMHKEYYKRLAEYDLQIGNAIDDLYDIMNWLRKEERFSGSDRIRTIVGRLARARRKSWLEQGTVREIARKFK